MTFENARDARDAMNRAHELENRAEDAIVRYSNLPQADRRDPVKRAAFQNLLFTTRPRLTRQRWAAQDAFWATCREAGLAEPQVAALLRGA